MRNESVALELEIKHKITYFSRYKGRKESRVNVLESLLLSRVCRNRKSMF